MKKTDLFTLLRTGPLEEAEIVFRHKDQYVLGKLSSIEYSIEAGGFVTFTLEGFEIND